MEAHGVREFPPDSLRGRFVRRALQAAVADVILPAFTGQVLELAAAGQPLTRDLAARATVYLQARTQYGIVDPAPDRAGRAVACGARRTRPPRARRPLRQARLDPRRRARAARRGGPRVPANRRRARPATERRRGRRRREDPAKAGETPTPAKATAPTPAVGRSRLARRRARAGDRDRPRRPARTARPRRRPRAGARRAAGQGGERGRIGRTRRAPGRPPAGCPTAASTGRRTPTRCSTHAATPIGCARRSRTARARSTSAPRAGGSTAARTRAAVPSRPLAGRSPSHPWRVTRQVRAPIQEPHVGLIIDTSGSMGGYEYALGPIAWILTDGLRQIGGRCATALFGNAASLLADGPARCHAFPGSAPAAAPRSPATRSSSSQTSSR